MSFAPSHRRSDDLRAPPARRLPCRPCPAPSGGVSGHVCCQYRREPGLYRLIPDMSPRGTFNYGRYCSVGSGRVNRLRWLDRKSHLGTTQTIGLPPIMSAPTPTVVLVHRSDNIFFATCIVRFAPKRGDVVVQPSECPGVARTEPTSMSTNVR